MKKTQALNPAVRYKLDQVDDRFVPIEAGWKYTVGDYTLEMISVPGHTPGNAMFWAKKQGIMFTGDHILFDISPNITSWLESEDSLGDYLDSLRLARKYPVRLALPGHRKTGDYAARIEALLRRSAAFRQPVSTGRSMSFRRWSIDEESRGFTAAGASVHLTRTEFDIVCALVRHPKKVYTKRELFEMVRNEEALSDEKTINTHVSNIRTKLKGTGTEGYVETVWGIGFKLSEGD